MNTSSNRVQKIVAADKPFTGIKIAGEKMKKTVMRTVSGVSRRAVEVRNEGIIDHAILGIAEYEGNFYLYGEWMGAELRPYESLVTADTKTALWETLQVARAFRQLADNGRVFKKIYPEGIFITPQGVLILPEDLMEQCFSISTLPERLAGFESVNHPDLSGNENTSFFLGCLAYRITSGVYPFQADSAENIHREIWDHAFVPAELERPGLIPEISDFISRSFQAENRPSLADWEKEISSWLKGPLELHLSPEEQSEKIRKRNEMREKRRRELRRHDFWRIHRTRVIIIAAVVLVLGYVASGIVTNILKPRVTRGFPPEKVISLFYESMNSLDHESMEDCVIDKAGQPYISEVVNLYVMSRVRMSVEMKQGLIDAKTWTEGGRQPLPAGSAVYGISELVIERAGGGEEEPRYRVFFHRWVPLPAAPEQGDGSVSAMPTGTAVQDDLILSRDKEDWVIKSIIRVSEKPLP